MTSRSSTSFLVIEPAIVKRGLANRPLLLMAVFVTLVGIQLITMGLVGEWLFRVYRESQRKPVFLVREIYQGQPFERPKGEEAATCLVQPPPATSTNT